VPGTNQIWWYLTFFLSKNLARFHYSLSCGNILLVKLIDVLRCTHDFIYYANSLAASPNILPCLCLPTSAKIHFRWITFWKCMRIQPSSTNGWPKIIAMYTSEKTAIYYIIPALHCSITSFGLLMIKSGEPITGILKLLRID
jgi:hypothetical protein